MKLLLIKETAMETANKMAYGTNFVRSRAATV